MTKIKMCGMMNPFDVISVKEMNVEYAGFILSSGFRRSLYYRAFSDLEKLLEGSTVKRVGVFVNEEIEFIDKYYDKNIDVYQLHGNEDNKYIDNLRKCIKKPIIKAFKIKDIHDVIDANRSTADMILLDSGEGSGEMFDHSLLNGIQRDFFLAGGLNPENISDVLKKISPYAVDVSSGIETNGKKDITKMEAFVNVVRRKV